MFVDFIDNRHRHFAIIGPPLAQGFNQFRQNPVDFLAPFLLHHLVEFIVCHHVRLPGQTPERNMAQDAVAFIIYIEPHNHGRERFRRLDAAFFQHLGRFAAMGRIVEVQIDRIGGLDRILGLVVALVQADWRQGNFAIGDVADFRIEVNPLQHFRSKQVGVQSVERFADVGLFAIDIEARQQFSGCTDIDIAILVAGIAERHEVGIDGGDVIPAAFRLQCGEILDRRQHPCRISLFIRHSIKHQIPRQRLRLPGIILHEHHQRGYAGFHIQNAAAQKPAVG